MNDSYKHRVLAMLSDITFSTDEQDYALLRLDARAITLAAGIVAEIGESFCALIAARDEVSLIIPHEAVADFAGRLKDAQNLGTFRLITADASLPPDLTGFMAVISAALAEAGVAIFPYAAYTTDHLLVHSADAVLAMTTLNALKAGT